MIWAVGVFLNQDKTSTYTCVVEVPTFMDGREIQELLNKENKQDGVLTNVIMTRGYTPPLQWRAESPAMICNAGGNDLLLYSPDSNGRGGQGLSELAWEQEYSSKPGKAPWDEDEDYFNFEQEYIISEEDENE